MKICPKCKGCFEDVQSRCDCGSNLIDGRKGNLELVDGYRIVKFLITESELELYKAIHLSTEEFATIRFCRPRGSNELVEEELRSVIGLDHPNLARVYEFGSINDSEVYIVGEYLPFETLKDRLAKAEPISEREAISIARQITEALEVAHNGLVVRNLAPENISLNETKSEGIQVKLRNLDFGGVVEDRIVNNAYGLGAKLDVVKYLAPEQLVSEHVDFRTDMFSFGTVFFEMLMGCVPFPRVSPRAIIDFNFSESYTDGLDSGLRGLINYTLKECFHHNLVQRARSTANLARQLRHLELVSQQSTENTSAFYISEDDKNTLASESESISSAEDAAAAAEVEEAQLEIESTEEIVASVESIEGSGEVPQADEFISSEFINAEFVSDEIEADEFETDEFDAPINQTPELLTEGETIDSYIIEEYTIEDSSTDSDSPDLLNEDEVLDTSLPPVVEAEQTKLVNVNGDWAKFALYASALLLFVVLGGILASRLFQQEMGGVNSDTQTVEADLPEPENKETTSEIDSTEVLPESENAGSIVANDQGVEFMTDEPPLEDGDQSGSADSRSSQRTTKKTVARATRNARQNLGKSATGKSTTLRLERVSSKPKLAASPINEKVVIVVGNRSKRLPKRKERKSKSNPQFPEVVITY